jgi:hypothetical protein
LQIKVGFGLLGEWQWVDSKGFDSLFVILKAKSNFPIE